MAVSGSCSPNKSFPPKQPARSTLLNVPTSHCLSWCQEQTSLTKVFESEARAIDAMRQGTEPDSYIDLPHGTRTHPIERRFPDRDTLAKLRALKKEFDPEGTFTKELL